MPALNPAKPRWHVIWLFACALTLLACSPALNWRKASLGGLQASLPCKPDSAERTVQLAGKDFSMRMMGCEADGGLFAISQVRLTDGSDPAKVLEDWQRLTLTAMGSAQPLVKTGPPATVGGVPFSVYAVSGKGPDGHAVQARLSWIQNGSDWYHLALYATRVRADMEEPFYSQLTWQ